MAWRTYLLIALVWQAFPREDILVANPSDAPATPENQLVSALHWWLKSHHNKAYFTAKLLRKDLCINRNNCSPPKKGQAKQVRELQVWWLGEVEDYEVHFTDKTKYREAKAYSHKTTLTLNGHWSLECDNQIVHAPKYKTLQAPQSHWKP